MVRKRERERERGREGESEILTRDNHVLKGLVIGARPEAKPRVKKRRQSERERQREGNGKAGIEKEDDERAEAAASGLLLMELKVSLEIARFARPTFLSFSPYLPFISVNTPLRARGICLLTCHPVRHTSFHLTAAKSAESARVSPVGRDPRRIALLLSLAHSRTPRAKDEEAIFFTPPGRLSKPSRREKNRKG